MTVTSNILKWTHPPRKTGKATLTNGALGKSSDATLEIYYELHGNGPNKVLFISGHGSSSRAWVNTLNYFAECPDEFEVCLFDNRGVGDSTQMESKYQIKDMAQDVLDLISHIGWTRVAIVGVSMGGMIAMQTALMAPKDMLTKLVLVSTSSRPSWPFWPPIRMLTTFVGIAVGWRRLKEDKDFYDMYTHLNFPDWWLDAPPQEPYTAYATNKEAIYAMLPERIRNKPKQSSKARSAQTSAALGFHLTTDQLSQLGKLAIPIKIMVGTEDYQIHTSSSHYLAQHIPAPIQVFEGGGHILFDMYPDRFHYFLLEFLRTGEGK